MFNNIVDLGISESPYSKIYFLKNIPHQYEITFYKSVLNLKTCTI